jgi:hypothetical protein
MSLHQKKVMAHNLCKNILIHKIEIPQKHPITLL